MYFTSTMFITQLLTAMQVLMTLDMPLSTTMALPVTSKPIESTVENLAWQAWIELPPEEKQRVKSRKVTPKSIFTLPNRIECPEGHKQVDTKCIPIVIGTNADLITQNYLTLIVGNSPTDEQYDYDDVEEVQLSYGPQMQIGEAEKSVDGLAAELKPPSKDEPLKFNIFENKFNIYHEEPLEDYSSSLSNEGEAVQSSEKEITTLNESLNSTTSKITATNDLVHETSTTPASYVEVTKPRETNSTTLDSDIAESSSNTKTTLADITDFKIDAISLPASGPEIQKPHKLSIFQKDASMQLLTTVMDTESENRYKQQQQQKQHQENDIQTLLQTESLLPLLKQATATTLLNSQLAESSSLTTVSVEEPNESSSDSFTLNIEDEMTTLPNIMEQELETKQKNEYTRSVTMNPLISEENYSNDDYDDNKVKDTTLDTIMNDEPLEITTAIQLDDTTIIENIETSTTVALSLSSLPADTVDVSIQQNLKELLLKQEQALKDFEELQRMRKGQKDQHTILKKSKVEPVEVLSTTTTTSTIMTTTTTTDMPTTKTMDELITAETVTPLLTVHNENDNNNNNNNNDRFYYQHFAKQDLEATPSNADIKQHTSGELTTTVAAAEIEAMPTTKTSEIDLAEELRLINELVKGISPATTIKTLNTFKTKTPSAAATTTETITTLTDEVSSSSSPAFSSSESSASTIKPTLSTAQIWSKIMPLLTTPQATASSTHTIPSSKAESSSLLPDSSTAHDSATSSEPSASNRSHRNSKIIRINGFNNISSLKFLPSTTPSSSTTTTTTEDPSSTTTTTTGEPYWWLPIAWRLDKSVSTENQPQEKEEEQPLLFRFWSAYHSPKSS